MSLTHRPIAPVEAALIAQVCTRSDVIWVRPAPEQRHHLVWHVWHDDAIAVVTGDGEQSLPPLGETVEIVARSKETAARVVTFLARVSTLSPGTQRWDEAVQTLAAARLNHSDGDEQLGRWKTACTVWLLRPVNVVEAVSGTDDTPGGRMPPPRGPGTTLNGKPFHLGKRKRRARRQQKNREP